MSVYTYPQSKVIDQVTFRTTERGTSRAYLHAPSSADSQSLQAIVDGLRSAGWTCTPYSENGQPFLEVRGFKWPTQLIKELEKNNWAQGESAYKKSPEDYISLKEKFKKRTLQASGWAYSIGDIAFFTYGYKGSSPLDMAAGVFYGLPTPVLIGFGKNDQSEFQIKDVAKKMRDQLKSEGVTLPPECSLDSITSDHKKGLINSAGDLLKRYPSEFMNLSYALAGACIMAAGIKHLKRGATVEGIRGYARNLTPHMTPEVAENWEQMMAKETPKELSDFYFAHKEARDPALWKEARRQAHRNNKIENWLNVGVGTFTSSSGILAASIKEKVSDPDAAKKQGLQHLWDSIKHRPLAIAGTGYIISTLLHAVSTTVAMKGQDAKHKQAVPWRALFVASALTAELLVAISSKGHGEGVKSDNSVDNSVLSLAAELIASQPAHMQNQLIDHMSHFLGRPDVLAIKDEKAAQLLRTQVEAMRNNPWVQCRASEQDKSVPTVTDALSAKSTASAAWQAKVAAKEIPAQPQLSS